MGLKTFLLGLTILLTCITIPACVSHNEEELYPDATCDTLNITYSGHIASIINLHCLACHSATAPTSGIPLEGYDNLKVVVDDELLIGCINHEDGFEPMPQNAPKLPDCDILQVELWVRQGAPNN